MKARLFAILAILIAPFAGHAIPLVKPDCNDTSYERGFRDLVHKVGIMDKDDRESVTVLRDKGVISEAELQNILRSTGTVRCPVYKMDGKGETKRFWSTGSAALVEDNQTLVTAAHVFYDDQFAPIRKLSECEFFNRAGQRVALKLKDDLIPAGLDEARRAGHLIMGFNRPTVENKFNDRAVVRLAKPVEGARGFKLDPSEALIRPGQELINVSAVQLDQLSKFDYRKDLVGQVCTAMEVVAPGAGNQTQLIKSDCDAMEMASGSILLSRSRRESPLTAVGVIMTGREHVDGKSYSAADYFTMAAAIDSAFIEEIRALGRRDRLMNTAAVSN